MDVTNPHEPLDLAEDNGWLHGSPGLSPAEHQAVHDAILEGTRIARTLDAENKRLGTGIYGPGVRRPTPEQEGDQR